MITREWLLDQIKVSEGDLIKAHQQVGYVNGVLDVCNHMLSEHFSEEPDVKGNDGEEVA